MSTTNVNPTKKEAVHKKITSSKTSIGRTTKKGGASEQKIAKLKKSSKVAITGKDAIEILISFSDGRFSYRDCVFKYLKKNGDFEALAKKEGLRLDNFIKCDALMILAEAMMKLEPTLNFYGKTMGSVGNVPFIFDDAQALSIEQIISEVLSSHFGKPE